MVVTVFRHKPPVLPLFLDLAHFPHTNHVPISGLFCPKVFGFSHYSCMAWSTNIIHSHILYSSNFYQTIIKQKFLFFWANTYLHKQMLPILGDKMQCMDTLILWYSDFVLKNQCINNAMYLSSSKPSIQRSSCTK